MKLDDNAIQPAKNTDQVLLDKAESGKIYARETISAYAESPKTLGETSPRQKYDAFVEHGSEVKPLSRGSLKGKEFLEGGGFKVSAESDGMMFQYHPETGSHHGGAYYKISNGKQGTRRFDMNGDEKGR